MVRQASVYHIDYERDPSGWWVGSVREVSGCHTQGRTIAETRKRIREALGLFVEDSESAQLADVVQMPADEKKLLKAYVVAREKAEREARHASVIARRVVKILATGRLRLSRRDAGQLLGISHQRVHQLLEAADEKGPREGARRRRADG